MAKMEIKSTELNVSDYNQDVTIQVVLTLDDKFKCRINVRSNSYKFQSHARAYVWNQVDLKWNLVYSIEPEQMQTETGLIYKLRNKKPTSSLFAQDIDTLVTQLKTILL